MIKDMFEGIRQSIGMDANSFYSMTVTVFFSLISVIGGILGKWIPYCREKKENQLFNKFAETDMGMFYCTILFVELWCNLLCLLIVYLFVSFVSELVNKSIVEVSFEIKMAIVSILVLGLGIVLLRVLMKMTWIRKRVMGVKEAKVLIYVPAIIIYFCMILVAWNVFLIPIQIVAICMLVLCEIKGILYFDRGCTVYKFSAVRLYLDNNEIIECPNIENVNRKKNILVINEKEQCVHVKYDKIWKVQYYGGQRVKQWCKEKVKSS